MSFVSFRFLVFAVATVLVYFAVPKKWQWVVILTANFVFYLSNGAIYGLYLLAAAGATYGAALWLEKTGARRKTIMANAQTPEEKRTVGKKIGRMQKRICAAGIVVTAGIWVVLKYSNFFIDNVNDLLQAVHLRPAVPNVSWILPLGISFYTFHAIGYLVDIYRHKYKVQRNFGKYFAYVSYFPHMIQGPFTRYDQTGQSILEPHTFSYERFAAGCARILWGLFKKLVIADKLGIAVTSIFADHHAYSGAFLLFAIFGYCIQLYADFSGYMDMACGLSNILGIDLPENFQQPYFARSVEEFWRRWHITLGRWFRDYVFYPVSMGSTGQKLGRMSRKKWGAQMGKQVPGYFALIFVWTATGLWHGASWTFLFWGYLNLIVIVCSMQLTDAYSRIKARLHIRSDGWLWTGFSILRTFFLVCIFRFFSTAPDVGTAFSMLGGMISGFRLHALARPLAFFINMTPIEIGFALAGIAGMLIVDILTECGRWEGVKARCPMLVRNLVYTVLILSIILVAGGSNDLVGGFMYANF